MDKQKTFAIGLETSQAQNIISKRVFISARLGQKQALTLGRSSSNLRVVVDLVPGSVWFPSIMLITILKVNYELKRRKTPINQFTVRPVHT